MCVIKLGRKQKKSVVGWKLFRFDTQLEGLCYSGSYQTGKTYVSKKGPGFQAFVKKWDAKSDMLGWDFPVVVCRIRLYDARKGIIDAMSETSDGKPGWCAPKMKVLSIRRKKVKHG